MGMAGAEGKASDSRRDHRHYPSRERALNSEYVERLTSNAPEVLERCLVVVDQLRGREDDRARSAESRAGGTLTAIAIVAGLIAVLAGVLSDAGLGDHPLILS